MTTDVEAKSEHECEQWHLQDSAKGGKYCATSGKHYSSTDGAK